MKRNNIEFRNLTADEIDVRIQGVYENSGITLLLYKDARVDMNILDETVGNMNWKKSYTRDNANCIVEIYDDERKEWISKEDTGVESFSQAEKGLASDSFKRSCFAWGIGRELYTSPFIWINWKDLEKVENGKVKDTFFVEKIIIKDKKITCLSIKNNKGKRVFVYTEKELNND